MNCAICQQFVRQSQRANLDGHIVCQLCKDYADTNKHVELSLVPDEVFIENKAKGLSYNYTSTESYDYDEMWSAEREAFETGFKAAIAWVLGQEIK